MKIYYTGIGCNATGIHGVDEFLDIMKREFTFQPWGKILKVIPKEEHWQLQYKDWVLPDDFIFFSLSDWIDYSGAEVIQ